MYRIFLLPLLVFILNGCNEKIPTKKYNAKKLLETKCANCHDINMPPIISDDELAPPMMAVSFHVHNFVEPTNESQRTNKAIEFVVDYVENPSLKKSFCDEESLKRYGLMPSQKENITKDETKAVATYMFEYFTQKNLTKKMQEQAQYDALPAGKKIALKYKCLGCHKIDKKIIGPSLVDISKKYRNNKQKIKDSIKNGSKANWKSSNGAIMPSFKQINDDEIQILSEWILNLN